MKFLWEVAFLVVPFWGESRHEILPRAGEKGSAAPRREVRGKKRMPTAQPKTQPPGPQEGQWISGEGRRALLSTG